MFDIVVERVAVANAFQRQLRRKRKQFGQAGVRGAKPVSGFRGQKLPQRLRDQFRNCDHVDLRAPCETKGRTSGTRPRVQPKPGPVPLKDQAPFDSGSAFDPDQATWCKLCAYEPSEQSAFRLTARMSSCRMSPITA